MKLYASTMTLEGVPLPGENPLPRFSDPVQDRPLVHDGTLTPEEEALFGFQTGKKALPYRMQDRYHRDRSPQTLKTIVMENEYLRAVFLPELGGRLYSLTDRESGEEVLYSNKTLQFGNLAQRNAWFSGGIEFNFGHYGHSALTCAPLFAGVVKGPNGSFLRLYELERVTGGFYQMDFHLPDGARTLDLFVRMWSAWGEEIPTYWWTNTAAPLTPKCRVFGGVSRVLISLPRRPGSPDHIPCFAGGEMPDIGIYGGDASYPAEIDFSCEYFFQYPADEENPWEALGYEDGRLFLEASTQPLGYRKMFCWGDLGGGHRWQAFLNEPKGSEYVELQAGIARTQLHGAKIPAGKSIAFTQSFGTGSLDPAYLEGDWKAASRRVMEEVRRRIPPRDLHARHGDYLDWAGLPVEELLHRGSGWGALECELLVRKGVPLPGGLPFPQDTMGTEQAPWLHLLEKGTLGRETPTGWVSSPRWKAELEGSMDRAGGKHWVSLLHLGVMRREAGDHSGAVAAWEESTSLRPSALAWRNLADYHRDWGDRKTALGCMEQAMTLPDAEDVAYWEEYLGMLVEDGQFQKVWELYRTLPKALRSDRVRIAAAECALQLGEEGYLEDFFRREFATLAEGETMLTDLWYQWEAQRSGLPLKDVRETRLPPESIDFRMFRE